MKKVLFFSLLILFVIATTNSLKAAVNSPDGNNSHIDLSKTSKVLVDPADPIVIKPAEDAEIRWADDKIIYDGQVYVNNWGAIESGIDNDAIDVDYFAGDTLRAIVACPDSAVRIFRSNDNGQSWTIVSTIQFLNDNVTEPHIVHGTDSTYHVFIRYLRDQDQLYTRVYKTGDDSQITGTGMYISGDDSVKNYSACTNRRSFHDYSVFVAYQSGLGGRGEDRIMFTRTTNQGQNWSAPDTLQWSGSSFPDITYGNDNILHETYIWLSDNAGEEKNYELLARRSLNFGTVWDTSKTIRVDTFPKMGPQIAAAYDGSGDVWIIWPRKDLTTLHDDWGLRWSWSTDTGATWSYPAWVNSEVDSTEVLPSIAVYDAYNSVSRTPQVSFTRCFYDWTGKIWVRSFYWQADSSWSLDSCRADTGAVVTRPVATFISGGVPAVAYVGENLEKVYFDSWANDTSGIEEDNDIADSDGKIECSLDCSIIIGTTTLKYTLLKKTTVNISLVNILGQKVTSLESGEKDSGEHTISVSAENLSQGIYYIVIETDNGQKGIAKAAILK